MSGGYIILELEPEKISNFEAKAEELYNSSNDQSFKFNEDWEVTEKKEDIFGLMRFIVLKKK